MKFLIDNHLPDALSRFFTSLDYDSLYVMEVGLGSASEAEVWRYACREGRVVVTKDEDFLHLAGRQSTSGVLIWAVWATAEPLTC